MPMLKAVHAIKAGGKFHSSGSPVEIKDKKEAKRLVDAGAAKVPTSEDIDRWEAEAKQDKAAEPEGEEK